MLLHFSYCIRVHSYPRVRVDSPVCLCVRRCCMECLLWPSGPCCLCTSGRKPGGCWACLYTEGPEQSPRTRNQAPHRSGHEGALRREVWASEQMKKTPCVFLHLFFFIRLKPSWISLARLSNQVRQQGDAFLGGSTCAPPTPHSQRHVDTFSRTRTEHTESYGGLSKVVVVLTGRHLAAILPWIFLCNRVDRQRCPLHLRSSLIRL